jgi:hypothetical protein
MRHMVISTAIAVAAAAYADLATVMTPAGARVELRLCRQSRQGRKSVCRTTFGWPEASAARPGA